MLYQINQYQLECSDSFARAHPDVIEIVTNGCGPGGWKIKLVPDTIYGLSVKWACKIHDWDYAEGTTQEEKDLADARFLRNMNTIISSGFILLRPLRRARALEYYLAVHTCGESCYWFNKTRLPESIFDVSPVGDLDEVVCEK